MDLVGSCGTGHAVIRSITFDVEEALVEAEVVLVSAMAKRHEAITDWIAPHLKDGQIVCFSRKLCFHYSEKEIGRQKGDCGPDAGKYRPLPSGIPYKGNKGKSPYPSSSVL